jgi:anti-sigma B factor antagonist
MEIKFNLDDTVGIITISGKLNSSNSDALMDEFKVNLSNVKNYVMDLAEMSFLDSSGLGSIVACYRLSIKVGGNIKIANLQDNPKKLFNITMVYRIFDIFDSVPAAVESFKSN